MRKKAQKTKKPKNPSPSNPSPSQMLEELIRLGYILPSQEVYDLASFGTYPSVPSITTSNTGNIQTNSSSINHAKLEQCP